MGFAQGVRGVPLDMSRIDPEFLDPDPPDRLLAADVLLRQEPDEEEDEEEEEEDDRDDKNDKNDEEEDDDDDDNNPGDGYSESAYPHFSR